MKLRSMIQIRANDWALGICSIVVLVGAAESTRGFSLSRKAAIAQKALKALGDQQGDGDRHPKITIMDPDKVGRQSVSRGSRTKMVVAKAKDLMQCKK
ncbi:MAG: hypothetical protein J3Q66DRAFT_92661 [Benniella sp.]|nr:MAG: hypothetical protein J3Q66DRAFT_92661 [Benniella sp.]